MWAGIQEQGFWQGEIWDRDKSGEIHPKLISISVLRDHHGEVEYHMAVLTDIREQKSAEERIRHAAHHDALTGLPNRMHLSIALSQALASARREGTKVALMFIDMNHFKFINDTWGHHIGDLLLIEVARRLHDCVRESDIVARLGGDEFIIALTGMAEDTTATSVASKVRHELGQPYLIESHTLHSSPSIGISIFPRDGEDMDALMKRADTAMYQDKERGRGNILNFNARK
jgi:diguanylate cyclase (GGDEF)-like protein